MELPGDGWISLFFCLQTPQHPPPPTILIPRSSMARCPLPVHRGSSAEHAGPFAWCSAGSSEVLSAGKPSFCQVIYKYIYIYIYIPFLPLTWHLTGNPYKRNMIFQVPSHWCHVSGREGIYIYIYHLQIKVYTRKGIGLHCSQALAQRTLCRAGPSSCFGYESRCSSCASPVLLG